MTNYEKYREEIIKILSYGPNSGLALRNGKPRSCNSLNCDQCDWGSKAARVCIEKDYENAVAEWLNAEYVEPPKLTKAERAFCESLYSDTNISRKPNGYLSLDKGFSHVYVATEFYNIKFEFITCDGTFWKVEDLLKLEVADGD